MKTSSKRARSATKIVAENSVVSGKNATQKPTQKLAQKSSAKPASRPSKTAKGSTPSAAAMPRLSAKKTVAAKTASKPVVAKSLFENVPIAKKTSVQSKAAGKAPTLKATKKRAPKDLANQYGEVVKAPRAAAVASAPRKRRNAATRAKLQAVIAPDDGLLLRLARAGAISSSHVADNGNGEEEKPFRATTKRRSRKWETRCGKCGVNAHYSTSAALCIKCGAILVRD